MSSYHPYYKGLTPIARTANLTGVLRFPNNVFLGRMRLLRAIAHVPQCSTHNPPPKLLFRYVQQDLQHVGLAGGIQRSDRVAE